ncbi:WD40 repeat domain-containing protein, partial [Streptomyces sp. Ncost-T10-10d]|uniref:WD40 repeat domain-containing protein n=1 Tax=Streptomyces sp. Ncost-T10-10d TaxID=1839774 RepID=UPI00352273AF
MSDPGWLVNADPGQVLAALDGATGREEMLAAAVYRASAHVHGDASAGVRRQVLALDAARYGDHALSARITAVPVDGAAAARWGLEWATGSMVDHRLRQTLSGHTGGVCAVAAGMVEGRPVAVTGSADTTARVWDLATGRPLGEILTGHTGPVEAVATAVVEGRPVAVTGSADKSVRVWDLATGQPTSEP